MCLLSCARTHLGAVFFIFSFIRISNSLLSDSSSVIQSQSCKYTLNNGEVIDLSPFNVSHEPLTVSTPNSLYIYHPCSDVPLKSVQIGECNKAYGLCYFVPKTPTDKPVDFDKVRLNEVPGNFTVLALNDETVFRENSQNQPEFVYRHRKDSNSSIITTIVGLVCDEKLENSKLLIVKTTNTEHSLTLSSRYICAQTQHYMSGGAVFFIILLVLIIIYFVGGLLVLKFIRGATGIEMIPNHEFWCSLPQLAKDGFKYVKNCGKDTTDSYEKI